MKIIRTKDYADMSQKAAEIIAAQVAGKPESVLGLATGSTPEGIYRKLVLWYAEGQLDFSRVTTFNLDEYYGIEKENEQSYRAYMHRFLFQYVNILPQNIHIPDGTNPEKALECASYDQALEREGPIDLQLLGIGLDGHIGFNEPGEALTAGTHCVRLHESTVQANARFFDRAEDVPRYAYTMGMQAIMQARKVILVANGKGKAKIIQQAFSGLITTQIPASLLQLHPDFTLIADEEALAGL